MTAQAVIIRPMGESDLTAVSCIEQLAGDVHWTAAQLKREWEKTISRYYVAVKKVQGFRFKVQGQGTTIQGPTINEPSTLNLEPETDLHSVIGFVGGWSLPPELQIANVVVHPEFHRKGVGRQLVVHLLARAHDEGCRFSTLEVRRHNAPARALYRALGFRETGVRPQMYHEPDDDAILMENVWT